MADAQTVQEAAELDDETLLARIRAGERSLFAVLMRRYNQRLFRITRSVVGGDAEAEEVVQEAYVKAFTHLADFEGRARFSTWLTKIALYEALGRKRREWRRVPWELDMDADGNDHLMPASRGPEDATSDRELGAVLAEAIDALPSIYRTVLVMREVEDLTTREAADLLGITEDALKVRLHRAKTMLRTTLEARMGGALKSIYGFDGERCDRIVASVMDRISKL